MAVSKIKEFKTSRIRQLLELVHKKAKEAGVTEKELRRDVKKALKERYGKGTSGY